MSNKKTNTCFIDLKNNSFHNFHAFDNREYISPQEVNIAECASQIVGKGTVKANLGVIITMKAYHAPEFSSNIISSHPLSNFFEVHMRLSLWKEKSFLLLRKGSLDIANVLLETKCVNGLYSVKPSSLQSTALAATKPPTNMSKHTSTGMTSLASYLPIVIRRFQISFWTLLHSKD